MAMAKFGLNWLISTVFKNAGQNQSQIDRFRSAFRLIQARNGTFFSLIFYAMRGEKVILFTKSSAHTEFLRRLISLSIWDYRQNIVF